MSEFQVECWHIDDESDDHKDTLTPERIKVDVDQAMYHGPGIILTIRDHEYSFLLHQLLTAIAAEMEQNQ